MAGGKKGLCPSFPVAFCFCSFCCKLPLGFWVTSVMCIQALLLWEVWMQLSFITVFTHPSICFYKEACAYVCAYTVFFGSREGPQELRGIQIFLFHSLSLKITSQPSAQLAPQNIEMLAASCDSCQQGGPGPCVRPILHVFLMVDTTCLNTPCAWDCNHFSHS